MNDWEDRFRGPCGIQYGVWIPRDPDYVKKKDEQKTPEPPKAPTNDSIKIKVVDDQTGIVVPGVMLDLQVPGGFIEPHETRRSGLIESLGLESGECEVSGDINDLTLKNTLLFVGVGDCLIEKAPEDSQPKGIPDPEPGTRYRVAVVEKHKVKVGETLKGLARGAVLHWDTLAKFNWGTADPVVAENYFNSSDIVYIPKQWSQAGLATNRPHTIRVKLLPAFIEDDMSKRARDYIKPLTYIYDPTLNKNSGGFRYVFEEGSLRCSHAIGNDATVCEDSAAKRVTAKEHSSFVYVDAGCFADNADGEGTRRRDFALVCGPHVYLCEFAAHSKLVPYSRIASVQKFFTEMAGLDCGIEVCQYLCANTRSKKLPDNYNLYLFLGDLHLPPLGWNERSPILKGLGEPDIFQEAGADLIWFLNSLQKLGADTKKSLHFVQTGDMFELWVGRDYLFKPGHDGPEWVDGTALLKVIDWMQDVIDRNTAVMNIFRDLDHAGLAEVRYLWGNHDGYLQRDEVVSNINRLKPETELPNREPMFRSSEGTIFCEHGHRFDRETFDNRYGDNVILNFGAYYAPPARQFEGFFRKVNSIGHPLERDCYLMGASLVNLYQHTDSKEKPFGVYVMAHTHAADLFRFEIQTKNVTGE